MSTERMTASVAAALLGLAWVVAPMAAAGAPSGLLEAARAWHAVLNDQDEQAAPSVYVAAPTHEAWRLDQERFRGIPVELGVDVVAPAGDRAALHLHTATGKYFLATWKKTTEGWRLSDIADLTPGLFLERAVRPAPVMWPSESSASATPVGVVYRLAQDLRHARPSLSQKDLEARFLKPSRPEDRAGYPELIYEMTRSESLPEVTSVKVEPSAGERTAEATVRLKSVFTLRLAGSEAGWRIVSASARPLRRSASCPCRARLPAGRDRESPRDAAGEGCPRARGAHPGSRGPCSPSPAG